MNKFETQADRLQADYNKEVLDQHETETRALLKNLEDFLYEVTNTPSRYNRYQDLNNIVQELRNLKLKLEPDFANKSREEMISGIQEFISYLKRVTSPVPEISTAITDLTSQTQKQIIPQLPYYANTSESFHKHQELKGTLEKISSNHYLSLEKINDILKNLPGVKVEIPEEEIFRLTDILPLELSSEDVEKINTIKSLTDGEKSPIMMQLPTEVIIDGHRDIFNLEVFRNILEKAHKADPNLPRIKYSDLSKANSDFYHMPFPYLRVYGSDTIKEVAPVKSDGQLAQVRNLPLSAPPDMLIAIIIWYLATGEKIMEDKAVKIERPFFDKNSPHARWENNNLTISDTTFITPFRGKVSSTVSGMIFPAKR